MTSKQKATAEQVEAILQHYSIKENVLALLNTTKGRTITTLWECLERGTKDIWLAKCSYANARLPEYKDSNTSYAIKLRADIGKKIFEKFILSNPQYFKHKAKTNRYAVTDEFVDDVLFYDTKTDFDYLDITNLLKYIDNPLFFEKITSTLYLPFAKGQTMEQVKRKYWRRGKRFKVRNLG